MSKKIYVGNMNYATTEDALGDLFAQYGDVVSVNIVKDRMSGRPKGFGFVEMNADEEAKNAITALDGYDFEGRKLRVNEAENKPRRNTGSSFRY